MYVAWVVKDRYVNKKLLDYTIYINEICRGLSSHCALFFQPKNADVTDHLETRDLTNLLAMLGDVIREEPTLSKNCSINVEERNVLFRNPQLCDEKHFIKHVQTDINNNNAINRLVDVGMQFNERLNFKDSQYEDSNDLSSRSMKNCSIKKSCNQDKSQNGSRLKIQNYETRNQVTRFTETGECTCSDSKRCHAESDCGYFCCGNYSKEFYNKYSNNLKNPNVKCSSTSPIEISDNKYAIKAINTAYSEYYVDDAKNCFESRKMNILGQKGETFVNDHQNVQSYVEHLEKCKGSLGECDLKNTRRNSVNNMLSHLRGMGAMKLPRTWNMPCRMEDQIKPVIESGEKLRCDDKCPNECVEVPPYSTKSIPLLITNGQGLVEIHVLSLQLATSAATILYREENLCNVSLFISWNIWGQETVCTPTLKCSKLNFNSSFVYHIPDLFAFFNCVLSEYVIFQANVVEQNTTYSVARAKLCIKDILDYPQNKLHYIAPMNSVIVCTLGMNFGQLSLWVRLSCDFEQVDAFKKQCGLLPRMEQIRKTTFQEDLSTKLENNDNNQQFKNHSTQEILGINERKEEKKEIKTSINSVIGLNDNKSVNDINNDGSSDSEIIYKPVTTVRKEKDEEEEKQQEKIANRENTVSIDDFNSLIFRSLEKDTIVIEIESVYLFENSSVMRDDDVHLLYVEYSFLGYRGADMETESLPKPKISRKPLIYNFQKTFPIDEKYHAIERNTLRAMLDESINPNIKFILVSEPLPEETDTKDCMELGYAYFNIREYALGDDNQRITLPITNPTQTERIGEITVNI
ncbi:hypothetical protein M0802_002801 [Mischocyttarus mexicanus]|nr:hypothetical protein M0802_002801 [Mischocyttarus mexicanus]